MDHVLAQGSTHRYIFVVLFKSPESYLSHLREGAVVPRGYEFGTAELSFRPVERPETGMTTMRLGAIESTVDANLVGVTTQNRLCGAPVLLARERIAQGQLRGLLVNNRVANVGSPDALSDARRVASAFATDRGYAEDHALSVSTGVVGWRIPVAEIDQAVPNIAWGAHPLDVAQAIMTTDRYPKLAWHAGRYGACLGIAKGAGMIEPHMATMLAFIMLDVQVDPAMLERVFRSVVERTFNRISVDGDQSTSDMVLCMANGAGGRGVDDPQVLESMLYPVCLELAQGIVRNGEGTCHVIEVSVRRAKTDRIADGVARHIANSPLVKSAVFGNDPNVGRVVAAAGDALSRIDPAVSQPMTDLTVRMFDATVYRAGQFRLDAGVERDLQRALESSAVDSSIAGYPSSQAMVPISLDFHAGAGSARVWGSDLSYEYVRENADYRT